MSCEASAHDDDHRPVDTRYLGFSRSTMAFPQIGLSRTRPRREGQKRQRQGVVARWALRSAICVTDGPADNPSANGGRNGPSGLSPAVADGPPVTPDYDGLVVGRGAAHLPDFPQSRLAGRDGGGHGRVRRLLRLPPGGRDGKVAVLPTVESHCSGSGSAAMGRSTVALGCR